MIEISIACPKCPDKLMRLDAEDPDHATCPECGEMLSLHDEDEVPTLV